MEKSYIKNMDAQYLKNLGFSKEQIEQIRSIVQEGIREKLYTNIHFPYHNIEHIERVLCYCIWIMNEIEKKNLPIPQKELLFYAVLYHDCGRSFLVGNKKHGRVGTKIASQKLQGKFQQKELQIIQALIENHVKKEDAIILEACKQDEIQVLSNLLKDADALDRNRIPFFYFAKCNPKYLRTEEAKKIYLVSKDFFREYQKAKRTEKKKEKEKEE